MDIINNVTNQNYTKMHASQSLRVTKHDKTKGSSRDTYVPSTVLGDISTKTLTKDLSEKNVKMLADKYDLQDMSRNQFVQLLSELRNMGVITNQEYSIGYGGALPPSVDQQPTWPFGEDKTNFINLLSKCAEFCKKSSNNTSTDGKKDSSEALAIAYSRLSTVLEHIAGDDISISKTATVNETSISDTAVYNDKIISLYERLEQDSSFLNKRNRRCTDTPDSQALARELLFTDNELLETFSKEIWIERAEYNQFAIKRNKLEDIQRLPKDYTGIMDEIKYKLQYGSEQDKIDLYSQFDGFLCRKASREQLNDVERLLSGRAESREKSVWQSFNERMEPIQAEIEKGFREVGYSFDVDKKYKFYLDTSTFTFSVTGGSDKENALIQKIVNTHPIENYKFDPLHTTLMALYNSRNNDLSYNPWQVNSLDKLYKEDLLKKYGVATHASDEYTNKMKRLISAYERCEMDNNMKRKYGFGIDDITYENNQIVGKTAEITKFIEDMGIDFMKETGFAYIELLNHYNGTPEFTEAVFVYENGEFKITYE